MKRGRLALFVLVVLAVLAVIAWIQGAKPRELIGAAPDSRAEAPTNSVSALPLKRTNDELPIMPAHSDDPRPAGPMHPHPITAEHERIFAENRLIGALNGAMDIKDVPALRRFLAQYRDQYPEDAQMLQEGYAVIADCLEHPGTESQAAARRWADEHRGSTLRRFVSRHCFQP
jgi:hypothetical protein